MKASSLIDPARQSPCKLALDFLPIAQLVQLQLCFPAGNWVDGAGKQIQVHRLLIVVDYRLLTVDRFSAGRPRKPRPKSFSRGEIVGKPLDVARGIASNWIVAAFSSSYEAPINCGQIVPPGRLALRAGLSPVSWAGTQKQRGASCQQTCPKFMVRSCSTST